MSSGHNRCDSVVILSTNFEMYLVFHIKILSTISKFLTTITPKAYYSTNDLRDLSDITYKLFLSLILFSSILPFH